MKTLTNMENTSDMIKEIRRLYPDGTRVTNKELKETLQKIYTKHGIRKTACATHIARFGYDTRKCKIRIDDIRRDGLILTLKQQYQ